MRSQHRFSSHISAAKGHHSVFGTARQRATEDAASARILMRASCGLRFTEVHALGIDVGFGASNGPVRVSRSSDAGNPFLCTTVLVGQLDQRTAPVLLSLKNEDMSRWALPVRCCRTHKETNRLLTSSEICMIGVVG
jgi:hypothetical protein